MAALTPVSSHPVWHPTKSDRVLCEETLAEIGKFLQIGSSDNKLISDFAQRLSTPPLSSTDLCAMATMIEHVDSFKVLPDDAMRDGENNIILTQPLIIPRGKPLSTICLSGPREGQITSTLAEEGDMPLLAIALVAWKAIDRQASGRREMSHRKIRAPFLQASALPDPIAPSDERTHLNPHNRPRQASSCCCSVM